EHFRTLIWPDGNEIIAAVQIEAARAAAKRKLTQGAGGEVLPEPPPYTVKITGAKSHADQISPVARAIAIMWHYSHKHGKRLPVRALLKLMPGTGRSTLYRSPQFVATRAAIKASLHGVVQKGHMTEGGGVEAEDWDTSEDE